jgi:hypothetical protein
MTSSQNAQRNNDDVELMEIVNQIARIRPTIRGKRTSMTKMTMAI